MVTETPTVTSLYLKPKTEKPAFLAGQYVTIKIPDLGPAEGKAYSLSSAPHAPLVRISIREIGRFSKALCSLNPGDTLHTSTPYGFFYPEETETIPLVFITGGIGITPCLSIIKDLTYRKDQREISLLYSNQTEADLPFVTEIDMLTKNNSKLTVHHFITRETPSNRTYYNERITGRKILSLIPEATTAEYFICGSMNFTKALWKDLKEADIPTHQLYTEGFF